jgi:hypothetical protein
MRAAALAVFTLTGAFAVYHPVYHHIAADDRVFTPKDVTPAIRSEAEPVRERVYRRADFAGEAPSPQARSIADWVADSGDNKGMPFVIIDKVDAKIFVFEAGGRLTGASAALMGSARGDDSAPGIGNKTISEITADERTTPAGRFVGERGINTNGEDIVWVDYDAAVSIHAVRANNPRERRLQRLASPDAADNRISYGCINVPLHFFRTVVAPAFRSTRGVVYVLPETRPAGVVFGSYDVPVSAAAPSAITLAEKR